MSAPDANSVWSAFLHLKESTVAMLSLMLNVVRFTTMMVIKIIVEMNVQQNGQKNNVSMAMIVKVMSLLITILTMMIGILMILMKIV